MGQSSPEEPPELLESVPQSSELLAVPQACSAGPDLCPAGAAAAVGSDPCPTRLLLVRYDTLMPYARPCDN